MALRYVGRYATTRAKLNAYLQRKVAERGWAGDDPPPTAAISDKCVALGFVDDRAFATARGAAFRRRGLGERRLGADLKAAGISEDDAAPARDEAHEDAFTAALRFAERKRIGPYGMAVADRDQQRRQFAMMLRAGHPVDLVRRLVSAAPGAFPEEDV